MQPDPTAQVARLHTLITPEFTHILLAPRKRKSPRSWRFARVREGGFPSFQKSKPILDEIDTVLAKHYGFTAEELDFIPSLLLRTGVNYDTRLRRGFGGQVKHRLGRDGGDEAE